MHAIRTFGRPVGAAAMLGASGTTAIEQAHDCSFTGYLADTSTAPGPPLSHGGQQGIVALALVGAGWLLGGIIPIVGRPIGSLVGASVAGAATYASYAKWRAAGGGGHGRVAGACDLPTVTP
jgi:hypothetical protein